MIKLKIMRVAIVPPIPTTNIVKPKVHLSMATLHPGYLSRAVPEKAAPGEARSRSVSVYDPVELRASIIKPTI
jgi:hypothetical protein